MKIVSWNVNGIKACRQKGFLKFLSDVKPDIVCCQEVKTRCSLNTPGYMQYWNNASEPGYSGTLILTKKEPLSCSFGFGIEEFDVEGRAITLEFRDYFVVNVYAPSLNPHSNPVRPSFRAEWDEALREYVCKLPKPVIMAGDFNVTRAFIDSYPENQKMFRMIRSFCRRRGKTLNSFLPLAWLMCSAPCTRNRPEHIHGGGQRTATGRITVAAGLITLSSPANYSPLCRG